MLLCQGRTVLFFRLRAVAVGSSSRDTVVGGDGQLSRSAVIWHTWSPVVVVVVITCRRWAWRNARIDSKLNCMFALVEGSY